MRLHELDLGNLADKVVGKLSGQEKKEKEERAELVKKTIGMYTKGLKDWERVKSENAEDFKKEPTEVFKQWFEYYFDRKIGNIIDHPGLISRISAKMSDYAEALIMYAGQDYYLRAKTPQKGSEALLISVEKVTKDRKVIADVKKLFGKYVVTGKNQKQLDTDKKPKLGITYTVKNGDEYKWLGAQWGNVTTGRVATKEVGAQLTQTAIDKGDVE